MAKPTFLCEVELVYSYCKCLVIRDTFS